MPALLNHSTFYLARQILAATLLITCLFIVIATLWAALPLLSALSRGMGLDVFLWLIVLAMPRLLPVLLPLSAALAVIFAYYRATSDSELVVMRATGQSNLTLARPALWVAFILTVANAIMAFYLGPQAFQAFKEAQFYQRHDLAALAIQPGSFRSLRSGTMFHVRERSGEATLHGILFEDSRDKSKTQTWMARIGQIANTPDGPRLVLRDGNLQVDDHDTGRTSVLYFESYTLDLSSLVQDLEERWRQPEERGTLELFTIGEPEIKASQVPRFRAEGHYRIVSAFFSGAVIVVAVVTMLIGPFNRRGQFWRIGVAFVSASAILLSTFLLRSIVERTPAATPLIYLAVTVPIVIALALIVWSDRRPAFSRLGGRSRSQPSVSAG